MSKKEKAASGETYESVKKRLEQVRTEKGKVYKSISGLRMKHKIAKGEKPKDKALLKEWDELNAQHKALKAEFEKLEARAKELKPASQRRTKYEYPPEVDTPEKKKNYRAKMRAQLSKAAEAPAKPEKEKKGKNSSEKEKAAKPEKKGKNSSETKKAAKPEKKGKSKKSED